MSENSNQKIHYKHMVERPQLFHIGDEVYYIGNEQPWAFNMKFKIIGDISYNKTFNLYFVSYLQNDEHYLRHVPLHDLSHYPNDILYPTDMQYLNYRTEIYRAKLGHTYFYITDTGDIKEEVESDSNKNESDKRYNTGNYFYTQFEAERVKNEIIQTIKKYHFNRHNVL